MTYSKKALEITKTSMILGVGSNVVAATGGNPAGLTAMSSMMPSVGTAMGAGMALDALRGLDSKKKKKR